MRLAYNPFLFTLQAANNPLKPENLTPAPASPIITGLINNEY